MSQTYDQKLKAVIEYLPAHWKTCRSSWFERRADVRYYLTATGYGRPFVDALLAHFPDLQKYPKNNLHYPL